MNSRNVIPLPLRLCALIAAMVLAVASAMASQAVDAFVASPLTDANNISVVVLDLSNGKVLENHNGAKPLIPASIMKSLTIATCVSSTGIHYKYDTKVYTDGRQQGEVLDGNIIVIGSGDPSLGSKQQPVSANFVDEIVTALKAKGIKRIEGQLLFDQRIFPAPATPPSWGSGDLSAAYGAGCFGFNYENNATGKSSIANPALHFEKQFRTALANAGIEIGWNVKEQTERRLLTRHISPEIDDIMRSCMRRSDNMFAEALLRTYALSRKAPGATAEGARLETEYWKGKGIDMTGVNIVDGSGLSRQNRLTANFLSQVLKNMAGNVDYVSYFPLAGQEGTLRSFLKDTPLDSYIALKTGSMNGIQCYAGYKLDYNFAPTHVVVVMINNMTADRSKVRKEVEKMLLEIFKK